MIKSNPKFGNINFNGGNLSSDGGAILIMEYLNRIHLKNQLNQIPFYEDRDMPVYSNSEIAYQLICKNTFGYFTQSDQKYVGKDPLISQYFSICSQPTVSRFFSRARPSSNTALREMVTSNACEFVNENVEDPIVDADSTLSETGGNQEGSAYIHHYGKIGYHPLVINEFNSKLLLSALLRTGNCYSSNGIVNEMKTILSFLDNKGNIRFRGDSAFYDTKLLSYLEDENITYYIRAKGFKALKRAIMSDYVFSDADNWYHYDYNHPYYGETEYEIGNCGQTRRIVYKVYWIGEDGQQKLLPEIYAVVTNDTEMSAKEVMSFYEKRGASENFTKELKNDFNASTLSHQGFDENELDFLICCLSYNLFHMFQNTILEGRDARITMNKFRMKYQKIAVRVSRHARKISLAFSSAYNNQIQFLRYWNMVLQI